MALIKIKIPKWGFLLSPTNGLQGVLHLLPPPSSFFFSALQFHPLILRRYRGHQSFIKKHSDYVVGPPGWMSSFSHLWAPPRSTEELLQPSRDGNIVSLPRCRASGLSSHNKFFAHRLDGDLPSCARSHRVEHAKILLRSRGLFVHGGEIFFKIVKRPSTNRVDTSVCCSLLRGCVASFYYASLSCSCYGSRL